MRKLIYGLLAIAIFCAGCQEETYQDSLSKPQQQSTTIEKVTIDDVPFLMPSVEKFMDRRATSRNPDDLELDLEHIIKYSQANGFESFNIAIVENDFSGKDDYYFQTMHIIKSGDDYKAFIAKYNAADDSKKFDLNTFTGVIELSDIEDLQKTIVQFENGNKDVPEDNGGSGGGGDTGHSGTPPSWMPDWLADLLGYWNGNPGGSSGSGSSPCTNCLDYGGYMLIVTPITIAPFNSNNAPDPSAGSGATVVTVANQQNWPGIASQRIKANLIAGRLGLTDDQKNWLIAPVNINANAMIYWYLLDNPPVVGDQTSNDIGRAAVKGMKANPGLFQSMNPFIIAGNIDASQLPPCSRSMVESFKNIQISGFAKIVQTFDDIPGIYKLTYTSQLPLSNPVNSAETDWERDNAGNALDWRYLVKISPTYLVTASKMAIARTLLHEMAHAYLLSYIEKMDIDLGSVDPQDFSLIYYAVLNNAYTGANIELYQHEQMARKLVNPIRDALQELDNNAKPLQYYEDLAWGALDKTSSFNNLYPQGSPARIRILLTNLAEDTMSPAALTGYPTQSPQSVPCN